MPNKKKLPIQATDRPGLNLKEADYIAKITRPNFDMTRDERIKDGYARGLTPESLLRNSGYTPSQLLKTLGLDKAVHHKLYDQLCEVHSTLRENRK